MHYEMRWHFHFAKPLVTAETDMWYYRCLSVLFLQLVT